MALAALAALFFALPLVGLAWRAPWSKAWEYLTDDTATTALRLSLQCSLWATALSLVFGVPLAWVLARSEFPGRGVVRAMCTLSMVLPPVVGGVARSVATTAPAQRGRIRANCCKPTSAWIWHRPGIFHVVARH